MAEGTVLVGDDVRVASALVQRKMLQLWLRSGMRLTRSWRPSHASSAVARLVGEPVSGRTVRARAESAVRLLERWMREQRPGFTFVDESVLRAVGRGVSEICRG